MKTPDIYKLGLHGRTWIHNDDTAYEVMRVPGGWIYTRYEIDRTGVTNQTTSTFVPHCQEFEIEQ